MATPVTFRQQLNAEANTLLRADAKAKLEWSKLPIADMPRDIQALAAAAIDAEISARNAKAALQSALDDKVQAPSGKRLIVALGRDVSPVTDSVLVAWANASSGGTRIISFDQFTRSA